MAEEAEFNSWKEQENFLFSMESRQALRPTQPSHPMGTSLFLWE
jgi:hypothetical protein